MKMNRGKETSHPIIHWFGDDLRLLDNPALAEAAKSTRSVVPIYIPEDKNSDPWTPGGTSRWWLYHSIVALNKSLEARGNRLILRRGRVFMFLSRLCGGQPHPGCKPPMRRSTSQAAYGFLSRLCGGQPKLTHSSIAKPPMRRSTKNVDFLSRLCGGQLRARWCILQHLYFLSRLCGGQLGARIPFLSRLCGGQRRGRSEYQIYDLSKPPMRRSTAVICLRIARINFLSRLCGGQREPEVVGFVFEHF